MFIYKDIVRRSISFLRNKHHLFSRIYYIYFISNVLACRHIKKADLIF